MMEAKEIQPSPPSRNCTIRVLADLSSRPSSARIAVSAASAASASRLVLQIASRSSAYAESRVMPSEARDRLWLLGIGV
jgi:hypothetical protein